jgi:hypothetical protein
MPAEQAHQPGNAGSKRYTQAHRERFFHLVFSAKGPGMSVRAASRELGISYGTGNNWAGHYKERGISGRKVLRDVPNPRTFDQLPSDAKYALEDFSLFREMFFDWPYQAWARDAGQRIVEYVLDPTERSFIDLNVFPGAGKTFMMRHLILWLVCGGGSMDPQFGRALRIMVGSRALKVAKHMVFGIRSDLELYRPFYNKVQKRYAHYSLQSQFGRFRPDRGLGEQAIWTADQFLLAQVGGLDVYEKEPSVQAASEESGFLGERVNLAVWDDIAVDANSRSPDQQTSLGRWFENEAEQRVEPGGTLILVGQRISPYDLHRHRLDARVLVDENTEETKPLYHHIIYPAHHDDMCDAAAGGSHRQWKKWGDNESGCMTDIWRLPIRDWMNAKSRNDYRTVMQQEDIDPGLVLVKPEWITGAMDDEGYPAPGCFDHDRAFGTHPPGVTGLIDYCSVDPSGSGWWAIEWWAYHPETQVNYLIWGIRRKMAPGQLLDWDSIEGVFTGHMEQMQTASAGSGHPIRAWVVEFNAFARWLAGYAHWKKWRQRWPQVAVIGHQTQTNKLDKVLGVTGLLPGRYKTGMIRIPRLAGTGPDGPMFVNQFVKELTTYSLAHDAKNVGFDTVMSHWIGEVNLPRVVSIARRGLGRDLVSDARLPQYLVRQHEEISLAR